MKEKINYCPFLNERVILKHRAGFYKPSINSAALGCEFPHRVEHLQDFVLLAGVQAVDDDHQPGLMLREAVDGLRHPRHQLHLVLQHLQGEIQRQTSETLPGASVTSDFFLLLHLHEAFALQFVHPVGGAVQPLPLRVQHRVRHLPPGPAVQQHGQTHHAANSDQHAVHCLVLTVHLEDSQQRHASNQASQHEDEEDEGRHTARLLPLPLT